MNELINDKEFEELSMDDFLDIIFDKEKRGLNSAQITSYMKNIELNPERTQEFKAKFYPRVEKVKERQERDRLRISKEYKKFYEETARRIFKNISPQTIGEIYETARCMDLELTSGVYFLRNLSNGLLKIGYAKDLFRRVSQIATAFKHVGYDDSLKLEAIHLCFEPHLALTESYFHKEFESSRVKGEWFDISSKELEEYFLLGDFEGDFIEGVAISVSDLESLKFESVSKNFDISLREMEFELFGDVMPFSPVDHVLIGEVRNKFYKIIKCINKHKVAIMCYDPQFFPEIKKVGITVEGAEDTYDFIELKLYKYNPQKIKSIVRKINQRLKEDKQWKKQK